VKWGGCRVLTDLATGAPVTCVSSVLLIVLTSDPSHQSGRFLKARYLTSESPLVVTNYPSQSRADHGMWPDTRFVRERLAFAQVSQDQEGLLAGVELPPRGPDLGPVAADDPGHAVQGLRDNGRKARKPPVAMKVVLVDCLIYRGLPRSQRRHAAPSPEHDQSVTTRMKRAH
jgi:hypothetical protein